MKLMHRYAGTPTDNPMVPVYTDADLAGFAGDIAIAKDIWVDDYIAAGRPDIGSCVLGNGIKVRYLAPRARKYTDKLLVRAPMMGNVAAFTTVDRALDYLKGKGLDAYYDDGFMD